MDEPIIIEVGGPIFMTETFTMPVIEMEKRVDLGEESGSVQNWAFVQELYSI